MTLVLAGRSAWVCDWKAGERLECRQGMAVHSWSSFCHVAEIDERKCAERSESGSYYLARGSLDFR